MDKREEILRICSLGLRDVLALLEVDFEEMQEICLRAGQPLQIRTEGGSFFVTERGRLCRGFEHAYVVPDKEIRETLEYMGNYSLYAYEEELRQGFLTVQGGHRVGVSGKVVLEQGRIKTMKYISFLHIRIAHEKKGCADPVLQWIYDRKNERVRHCLIVSPPGCGKTTLLRDLIRQISNGTDGRGGISVGVVDERSELAACYKGIPQNDLGRRTDVLDGCPKTEGMVLMLRSMSPGVLAVDEIGGQRDLETVLYAANSGCSVLATAHAGSMEEVRNKWCAHGIGQSVFERLVLLSRKYGAGTIEQVWDGEGQVLYMRKEEGLCG